MSKTNVAITWVFFLVMGVLIGWTMDDKQAEYLKAKEKAAQEEEAHKQRAYFNRAFMDQVEWYRRITPEYAKLEFPKVEEIGSQEVRDTYQALAAGKVRAYSWITPPKPPEGHLALTGEGTLIVSYDGGSTTGGTVAGGTMTTWCNSIPTSGTASPDYYSTDANGNIWHHDGIHQTLVPVGSGG